MAKSIFDANNKRFGRFKITRPLLDQAGTTKTIMRLFSKMIVLRCEFLVAEHSFEYQAWCPMFDIVKEGEMMPTYYFEYNRNSRCFIAEKINLMSDLCAPVGTNAHLKRIK